MDASSRARIYTVAYFVVAVAVAAAVGSGTAVVVVADVVLSHRLAMWAAA